MRIAYVLPASIDPTSSVGRKVDRTLAMWRELGVEYRLFTLGSPAAAYTGEWGAPASVVSLPLEGRHNELRRQLACRRMSRAVLEWAPDVVYSRIFLFALGMERLHRRTTLVHEVNSDDVVEFPRQASRLGRLHPSTRHLTLRHVDGFVFVTGELRDNPGFRPYDVPSIVIGNGIDVGAVPRHPAPFNERPRILFLVGSSSPWTGVDKLAQLAANLPEFDFDLVGADDASIDFPSNVYRHDYATGAGLEELLRRADIGLGTLALHRKSMNEACTLKVREYLARGIPVILPYRDTDIPPSTPSVLSLPNVEGNVVDNVERVREFVLEHVGKRTPESLIQRIDSRQKEERRLAFLTGLLR